MKPALALACALLLNGCTAGGTPERVQPPEGLRTDPDGHALVASYTGGACDGADRLAVSESTKAVEVSVRVKPDGEDDAVCPAVGVPRVVRAELSSPLGDRTVLVEGKQVRPFDGAALVMPTRLPDGYALRSEAGTLNASSWTQHYGPRGRGESGSGCRTGDRTISISTGPRVLEAFRASYFTDEGPVKAGDGPARLYIQGEGPARHLALRLKGAPVSLSYSADCGGPTPTRDNLLALAAGLRAQL